MSANRQTTNKKRPERKHLRETQRLARELQLAKKTSVPVEKKA